MVSEVSHKNNWATLNRNLVVCKWEGKVIKELEGLQFSLTGTQIQKDETETSGGSWVDYE